MPLDLSPYTTQAAIPQINQLYQMMLGSPAYAQALGANLGASNTFNQQLQSALGQTGLQQSGIGAVTSALGGSLGQFGQGQLNSQFYNQAMQAALQNQMARMQAYTQYQTAKAYQPTLLGQLGGSLLGAAGTALGGFLTNPMRGAGGMGNLAYGAGSSQLGGLGMSPMTPGLGQFYNAPRQAAPLAGYLSKQPSPFGQQGIGAQGLGGGF